MKLSLSNLKCTTFRTVLNKHLKSLRTDSPAHHGLMPKLKIQLFNQKEYTVELKLLGSSTRRENKDRPYLPTIVSNYSRPIDALN